MSLHEIFIEDFERQHWKIDKTVKTRLDSKKSTLITLYLLDFLVCHIVVGPSVVAYWRGIWDYSNVWLEDGLCKGDTDLANIMALVTGLTITMAIDMFHTDLARIAGTPGHLRHTIVRHVFSLTWGSADIIMWKGLWDGYDIWAGRAELQSLATISIGLVTLTLGRSLRSAQSMPIGVNVDVAATHIKCETFLDTDHSSPWSQRLLDALLSRVMEVGVVLLWHGTWTLMDLLSEEDKWLGLDRGQSAWLSLAVGWSGGLLLFAAQFLVLLLYYCDNRLLKCMFHVIFYLYILFGVLITIASFRGSWYLLDLYFIPEAESTSQVLGMIFGALILCSLKLISCLHAGIFSDSHSEGILIGFHILNYRSIEEEYSELSSIMTS